MSTKNSKQHSHRPMNLSRLGGVDENDPTASVLDLIERGQYREAASLASRIVAGEHLAPARRPISTCGATTPDGNQTEGAAA
jgi:hypothetical protein